MRITKGNERPKQHHRPLRTKGGQGFRCSLQLFGKSLGKEDKKWRRNLGEEENVRRKEMRKERRKERKKSNRSRDHHNNLQDRFSTPH